MKYSRGKYGVVALSGARLDDKRKVGAARKGPVYILFSVKRMLERIHSITGSLLVVGTIL